MSDYDDERPNAIRLHVAMARASAACMTYTRDRLREHAKAHGITTAFQNRFKFNLACDLATHGLIDRNGYLRDGFPTPKEAKSDG